jgi:hypothetical protein
VNPQGESNTRIGAAMPVAGVADDSHPLLQSMTGGCPLYLACVLFYLSMALGCSERMSKADHEST